MSDKEWLFFVFSNKNRHYYRKIPKIIPGAYIFQRPFLRGLCKEGNLRFKIDWPSLLGRKPFFFVLLCTWGQFPSTSPGGGAYIWRGDLTKGFLRYKFTGASIWKGLFSELYRSFWIEKQRHWAVTLSDKECTCQRFRDHLVLIKWGSISPNFSQTDSWIKVLMI